MEKQTKIWSLEVGRTAGGARHRNPSELEKHLVKLNDDGWLTSAVSGAATTLYDVICLLNAYDKNTLRYAANELIGLLLRTGYGDLDDVYKEDVDKLDDKRTKELAAELKALAEEGSRNCFKSRGRKVFKDGKTLVSGGGHMGGAASIEVRRRNRQSPMPSGHAL